MAGERIAGPAHRRHRRSPGRQISERLLAHVNGDTPAFQAALLSARFPFFYWKLFGDKQSYRLQGGGRRIGRRGPQRHAAGVRRPVVRGAVSFRDAERPAGGAHRQPVLLAREAKFYDFTRDAFARMQAAGTQTLVIDIRGNSGGDDDMWLEGIALHRHQAVPQRLRLRAQDHRRTAEEGQKVGDVVRGSQSTYQPALDNPLRFTGKVYVLIGPYTYSSADPLLERCPGLRTPPSSARAARRVLRKAAARKT